MIFPRFAVVLFAAAFTWAQAQKPGIVATKHNLSLSGPGPVRAVSEERICVFCHTPHGARSAAPLWNRRDSRAAYIPYDSPSLKAQPGQPTGSSKLCLSCHDGTIALGDLISEDIPIAMTGSPTMPPGHGLIGTDLRDDHPISFLYAESLAALPTQLAPQASWDPRVKLDAQGVLQCTTCHDPHDNQWGQFLVMDNASSVLCRQCHSFSLFEQTPHAQSTNQWNGVGEDPWPHTEYPDVLTNACLNCHLPHHAQGPAELVTHLKEEDVCLVCHDGTVAPGDLRAVFRKTFHHPVERTTGVHQTGENPRTAVGHVECVDCHNPHMARDVPAEPPFVMGVLAGVSGVDSTGLPVNESAYEYEVCFKCHSQDGTQPFNAIPRQIPTSNAQKEFSPSSPSFHPVETSGRGTDVPSLLPPLTIASVIYCSDCHGNNDPGAKTNGTAGPHGSDLDFLLVRDYRTGSQQTESETAYALCYGCHNRESILNDQSFPDHRRHIVEEQTPCSVCHDAHGIDFGRGTTVNNAHLINFDTSVVQQDSETRRLEYRSLGFRAGECYLRCHNEDHSPKRYPED